MKLLLLSLAIFSGWGIEARILAEQLYTIREDGAIRFPEKTYDSAIDSSYVDMEFVPAGDISYASQGLDYRLVFYNFKDWDGEEPGFGRLLEIYCNNEKILEFGDQDGWIGFGEQQSLSSVDNDKCLVFSLPHADIILLQTYPYESLPNIAVIAIQRSIARVVLYTTDYWVESIARTEDGYFRLKLKDDWGEEGPNPYPPKEYVLEASEGGMTLRNASSK